VAAIGNKVGQLRGAKPSCVAIQKKRSGINEYKSMDWIKGKFTSESPIFNGKIYGFLLNFP
jgi:hypothetical protein